MEKLEIKPLKNSWVCVNKDDNPFHPSISFNKKQSINSLLDRTTMTWEECEEYGWKCIKVNINFEILPQ